MKDTYSETIGIIACGKRKRKGAWHQACRMYSSGAFQNGYKWLELHCSRIFIISAKYGLIESEKLIRTYDQSVMDFTPEEKLEWETRVREQVMEKTPEHSLLVLLASKMYESPFLGLDARTTINPVRGMDMKARNQFIASDPELVLP